MPHKNEAARKAYHKKYHAKWYKENKEKRNAQIAEYEKTKPKDWRPSIGRKSNLRRRHKITPQEYETKLAYQDYKCAICGRDNLDHIVKGKRVPLYIDHCHKSGNLRDLLCFNCNSGLGQFKDNIEILQKAIEYLQKHMI